jgi:hypothetical protein
MGICMPTAEDLLYAPTLKLKRAEHHINDLSNRMNAFLVDNPPKIMIQIRGEASEIAFRPKKETPIPDDFSVIIGDAVHNLRSALDVTLYSMARDTARKPERIQFPFPKDATHKAFKDACESGQIEFTGEKVVETIRLLKPYPAGNPILNGIHALSITDKHRLLILVRAVPYFVTGTSAGEFFGRFIGPWFNAVPPGIKVNLIAPKDGDLLTINLQGTNIPSCEHEAAIQLPFVISFGENQPFSHTPVIESLVKAKTEAARAVEKMVAAFMRQ